MKVWDVGEFIALATQFIPPQGMRLIRYYGLYSSRSRWKWEQWNHVASHAPQGWKEEHGGSSGGEAERKNSTAIVPESAFRSSWAKVYEFDLIGGSCLRSKQREPPDLSSVQLADESACCYHRRS
jgi:hypothetical protein